MTIEEFIEKWHGKPGGAERSNLHLFIVDLCDALGVDRPEAAEGGKLGRYEFDAAVPGGSFRSTKATGFIDLYKRGCFVLEAKQSQLPSDARQGDLLSFEPAESAPRAPSGARYDKLMRDARAQAENYAKNLPGDHPPVPFILVLDIGRAFEIEFDYTGNGRGYGFYPDKQSYRIELPDLAKPEIAERLRNIWVEPDKENPRLRSAEVTSGIARRLARVSQALEASNRYRAREEGAAFESQMIEETSLFLMRIIFCMFAEDIGLLPKDQFKAFLEGTIEDQTRFENGLHDLWTKMNQKGGGFAWAVNDIVKYFNGGLFESDRTFAITNADRGELYQAAKSDWKKVEPAIFGTLLEQALTKAERAKLGAHYTPRPYVERLVQATIMDVLEPEWAAISSPLLSGEGQGASAPRGGDSNDPTLSSPSHQPAAGGSLPLPAGEGKAQALAAATAFHTRLASLRILDPACGTGNFLYVAMEALQQLEAKVIETIQTLGGEASAKVGPHQFHGLELNPRAAKIAELVLWIGWLRFRIANDPGDIHDPVLDRTANINFGRHGGYDAVLARDETGEPDLDNPHAPAWPEADFIIGNPPFIGKGDKMRAALGDDYLNALWAANPRVPKSANFVMQWWDRAAHALVSPKSKLIRFGFVTTNTISQPFNRRILERYLSPSDISLVYAVPDHPWTKASGSAMVRIAMTVAARGELIGVLQRVTSERDVDSDNPVIETSISTGGISSKLTVGTDTTHASKLRANEGMATNGVLLAGRGFVLTSREAQNFKDELSSSRKIIRPYLAGSELMQHPKHRYIITFSGLSEREAAHAAPRAYQHLLQTVAVARKKVAEEKKTPDAIKYSEDWWVFAKQRTEFRIAVSDLQNFIVTTETTKYRIFQLVDSATITDHMIVGIALDDFASLGILSSSIHYYWTMAMCGMMGVATISQGHRYTKSEIFDTFPFPLVGPAYSVVAEITADLDAHRGAALADVPNLTITELYNLRDKLRSGAALSKADQDRATAARAGIVNRLHEQLDAAVAAAYGWPADLPPSEIVTRLVALNAQRAAEEKAGTIRWLRPEYQEPRFAPKAKT